MQSNSDRLVRSTVKIEAVNDDTTIATGSGMLMYVPLTSRGRDEFVLGVVTNKHVVVGATHAICRLAKKTGDKNIIIKSNVGAAIMHPNDNIDLCFLPLPSDIYNNDIHSSWFISSDDIFTFDKLNELTSIERVVMIGYPDGIIDTKNLYPITRQGVTATPAFENLDGKPDFMIDCACFPGSSGSPVFIFDQGLIVRKNNEVILGTSRFGLLGFLYAGPVMNQEGKILSARPPINLNEMVEVPLMLNLGICVRADEINGIIDQLVLLRDA